MFRFRACGLILRLSAAEFSKFLAKPLCHFDSKCAFFNSYYFCTVPTNLSGTNCVKRKTILDPIDDLDLSDYGPAAKPTDKFADYADKSVVLQEFIKLGVNLHALEKDSEVLQYFLGLDYERNVKAHLLFLFDLGLQINNIGTFVTQNPMIFKEDLMDLKVRVEYLKSKKFTDEMITQIISKFAKWLSIPVKVIDEHLGSLQEIFSLRGDDVRSIVTQVPLVACSSKKQLSLIQYVLKEEMNFDKNKIRKIVLGAPAIIKRDPYKLLKSFDYLTKTMKVPVNLLLQHPILLVHGHGTIKERNIFLTALGRAQYNPLLPGYVSVLDLLTLSDEKFCQKVALTSVHTFNEFLRTQ